MAAPTAATRPTNAHAKALAINLDPSFYGSFAEIGAGQEVARWFLTVGGAAGTIAQTISAYDKTFSDDTYGAGTRYVSKERLLAMLDREYQLLLDRLGPTRGEKTRFFVFADTASARNYRGDNQQHAWIGVRFETEPGAAPSEVLLHVNLMSPTALLQQQAIGLLGVNLLHAVYQRSTLPDEFLEALWDELSIDQLEIDVLEFRGPAFSGVDSRVCCLQLLRRGMSHAIVFDDKGQATGPAGAFHKRPLLVDRGRFETVEPFHEAMLRSSEQHLRAENLPLSHEPLRLLELTVRPMQGEPLDDATILTRIAELASWGTVMVSDYGENYQLTGYLRRYTTEPIRLVIGVSLMAQILEERFYHRGAGQLFEGLGKLLATDIKICIYPMPLEVVKTVLGASAEGFRVTTSEGGLVTADDLHPGGAVEHLYRYLREANWVVPIGAG